MFSQLFGGDIWTKIRNNPKTSKYLEQPDFVNMVTQLQKNPSLLQMYSQDPRISALLGVLLGIPMGGEDDKDDFPMPQARKEPPKEKVHDRTISEPNLSRNLQNQQLILHSLMTKGKLKKKKTKEMISTRTRNSKMLLHTTITR
jgi:hypothetical protein